MATAVNADDSSKSSLAGKVDEVAKPTPDTVTPPALSVSQQLQHCTVQIRTINAAGEQATGTGFLFGFFRQNDQSVLALVTNKHVVASQKTALLKWTLQTPTGQPDYGNSVEVRIDNFETSWMPHPNADVDLAIILVGELITELSKHGKRIYTIELEPNLIPTAEISKDLQPLEDIIVVGYPDGISDSKNNIPIFRRGITATPSYVEFEGRKQFLIDAAIFPGSSGSPVLLYNNGTWMDPTGVVRAGTRVMLLGVVFAVAQHATNGEIKIVPAPTQYRQVVVSNIPNNLGVCLHSSLILEFELEIIKRGYAPPEGYVVRAK